MKEWTEQRVGYALGLLGGALIALGGLVRLTAGTVDLILNHPMGALSATSEAVVLFVLGGLAMFFAWLVRHDWSSRPLAGGVLLVVVAMIGWAVVGVGDSFLALLGAILVFLAGVVVLIDPARSAAKAVVAA